MVDVAPVHDVDPVLLHHAFEQGQPIPDLQNGLVQAGQEVGSLPAAAIITTPDWGAKVIIVAAAESSALISVVIVVVIRAAGVISDGNHVAVVRREGAAANSEIAIAKMRTVPWGIGL